MKKIFITLALLVFVALPGSAQIVAPEAWAGAAFGAVFGGVAGSDCHHGFSGTGAAIGAGAGFVFGAITGELNRRAISTEAPPYYYQPQAYAQPQPGYGYVYGSAPVAPPSPFPVVAPPAHSVQPKPAAKPAPKTQIFQKPAHPAPQIADAPRVSDAPTF